MEDVIQTTDHTTEKDDMEALLSYLNKGNDDLESGRIHNAEEAFRTIRERMEHMV